MDTEGPPIPGLSSQTCTPAPGHPQLTVNTSFQIKDSSGCDIHLTFPKGFPGSSAGKESACNAGDPGSIPGLERSSGEGKVYPVQYSWTSLVAQLAKNPPAMWETWVGKMPWRRAWQPTSVFLPGKFHGHRSLAGCSPWGHKESDKTEQLNAHTS